ncbi:hypothetical protein [uncultured Clostridium sp.]|uniref:hypothetical protein n=1 Tax=uncultured Clostridium sp. TaxID=59620 RepID=UPI00261726CC|nr:hypothetical protein [uncultured Clostridium sp.]
MIKKLINIYVRWFKYNRRLSKLLKTLDILIEEFDYTQKLENKKALYRSMKELHQYTNDLLKESKDYIENSKF